MFGWRMGLNSVGSKESGGGLDSSPNDYVIDLGNECQGASSIVNNGPISVGTEIVRS